MKKRILYVTVLLMLLSVVLFGCGKKSYFQKRDGAQAAGEESGAEAESTGQTAANVEAAGQAAGIEAGAKGSSDTMSITQDASTTSDGSPQEVIVKVYVYNDSDAMVTESISGAEVTDKSGLIDINSATKEELMT